MIKASLAASLFAASSALAAVETHSVDYSYSLATNGDNVPRLAFPGFDDHGGTRVLTNVGVRVQATISASVSIENMTTADLGGWTLEADHTVLAAFERVKPEVFGPFAFLGGLAMEPLGSVLDPNDGTANAGADYLTASDSVAIDSISDVDPSEQSFFLGGGEVIAMVGPFAEFQLDGASQWNEFDGGDAVINFTELAQTGTFSLIYTYTAVPEPTTLFVLAGVVTIAARRKR